MSKCREVRTDAVIVFAEKGRTMRFKNPQRLAVTTVQVDSCEIREGLRCDNMLIEASNTEHFVELKGSDVAHACQQILATIKQLGSTTAPKHAWIVSSRVPQDDSVLQKAKLELRRKSIKLAIKNSVHEYTLP